MLDMAHSFLQVLGSGTSSGELVVPGSIVGVLTLLRIFVYVEYIFTIMKDLLLLTLFPIHGT